MARVTIGRSVEFHFQSPSEMVAALGPAVENGAALPLPAPGAFPPGASLGVVFHVPWLGRRLELTARVLAADGSGDSTEPQLRLGDGPLDTISDLAALIGRLRSGAILHDTSSDEPAEHRIRAMSSQLRAMLASHANAEERLILAREADPRVIDHLLKNPGLTIDEVRRIGSRLSLNHGHFSVIARNPAWMGDEMLRTVLSRNPRLPEFLAETILQTVSTPALKSLAEAANVTASTRRVAQRVLQSRGVAVSLRKAGA